MKKRSFMQLKKAMTYDEFNKFCKKITEQYANSEAKFAQSYFCEQYNISRPCYYKILEYAVVTNLVEDIIVGKMMKKAVRNQSVHKQGAGGSSISKYAKMYTKRCEYIAASFPEQKVKQIAEDFANNPDIPKKSFADMYRVERKTFELILQRAIETNIVDDDTFEKIKNRSIKNNSSEDGNKKTEDYFLILEKKRQANKKTIS